jgi:hypothetical protein
MAFRARRPPEGLILTEKAFSTNEGGEETRGPKRHTTSSIRCDRRTPFRILFCLPLPPNWKQLNFRDGQHPRPGSPDVLCLSAEPLLRRFAEDVSSPVMLLSLGPAHTSGRTPPAGCPGINGTLWADSCGTDVLSNASRSPVNALALNTAGSSPIHVLCCSPVFEIAHSGNMALGNSIPRFHLVLTTHSIRSTSHISTSLMFPPAGSLQSSQPTRLLHPASSRRPASWSSRKHKEKDTGVTMDHSTFGKVCYIAK